MGVFRNAKVLLNQSDIGGKLNSVSADYGTDELDDTTFGNATRKVAPGLFTFSFGLEGLYEAGADKIDETAFEAVGSTDAVLTLSPSTGGAGDRAYIAAAVEGDYSLGGQVGDLHQVSLGGGVRDTVARGKIIHNGQVAATGNSAAVEIEAVSADEKLYGALHVTSASSTSVTLDVKVQSDGSTSFGSPTDRLTFSQVTGKGFGWQLDTSSSTDIHYRVNYTLGSTGETFNFICSAGVQ